MVLRLLRVAGTSMAPALVDGDYVVAIGGALFLRSPRAGDVVLVRHPALGLLVKRIRALQPGGRLTLSGDNSLSQAGEALGTIEPFQVAGRVVLRIPRKGRPRRVRNSAGDD